MLSDYAFRNCIENFGDDLSFEEVAKLIVTLEQGMQKGLINNQSSGVAACARQIISLAGLAADSKYNSRGRKTL